MSAIIDSNAIHAIFEVPSPEGVYDPKFVAYFRAVGQKRPVLLLSFAPKAAGTFFRQAAMEALGGGYLLRLTQAQGGRDGTPYLPALMAGLLDAAKPSVVVHIHMQALPANRHFIEMFGLKPVIMLRSIPDMLVSYWDMLEVDPVARADGLNCLIPSDFTAKSRTAKADFMIDIVAPWYASYFATWKDYADAAPERTCVLRYDAFSREPAAAIQRALAHAGFGAPLARCEEAVAKVWGDRHAHRFNQGVSGRSREYFSPAQLARLAHMIDHYPQLAAWREELLGGAEPIRLAS